MLFLDLIFKVARDTKYKSKSFKSADILDLLSLKYKPKVLRAASQISWVLTVFVVFKLVWGEWGNFFTKLLAKSLADNIEVFSQAWCLATLIPSSQYFDEWAQCYDTFSLADNHFTSSCQNGLLNSCKLQKLCNTDNGQYAAGQILLLHYSTKVTWNVCLKLNEWKEEICLLQILPLKWVKQMCYKTARKTGDVIRFNVEAILWNVRKTSFGFRFLSLNYTARYGAQHFLDTLLCTPTVWGRQWDSLNKSLCALCMFWEPLYLGPLTCKYFFRNLTCHHYI